MRILFITHQLSKTGAPIVLLDLIRYYKKQGHEILVMSMAEGELRDVLENMGIPVMIREHFLVDFECFLKQAEVFDFIIANTLITFEAIHVLKYSHVPVIWWLHEGRQYFEYFEKTLPDFHSLPAHIRIYAVSSYVQHAIKELYGYFAPLLPIGIRDVYRPQKNGGNKRLKFLVSGTYSKLKGQDLLAEALRKIPLEYRDSFQIEFYGNLKMRDEAVFGAVQELEKQYSNLSVMPFVSHEEMLKRIATADLILIPSRVDPLPTVAAEAMMEHVPCIISDVCGIAAFLEDGKSGYIFKSEDADALAEKIIYVIQHAKELPGIGEQARRIYDQNFSYEIFEKNAADLIKSNLV